MRELERLAETVRPIPERELARIARAAAATPRVPRPRTGGHGRAATAAAGLVAAAIAASVLAWGHASGHRSFGSAGGSPSAVARFPQGSALTLLLRSAQR